MHAPPSFRKSHSLLRSGLNTHVVKAEVPMFIDALISTHVAFLVCVFGFAVLEATRDGH